MKKKQGELSWKDKRRYPRVIIFLFFIILITSFYYANNINYKKHIDIKQNLVKHPENLPTKETALLTSFWFKNLRADLYWLQTIQYIWWNAISSEYKKYLYQITDLVTTLNPYFEHPYLVAQLLLPNYNERYEKLNKKDITKYQDQAIQIWLKWVNSFCPNQNKLNLIRNEKDLQKIWTDDKYKNPCRKYTIPYYLAYVYYFYKNNPLEASVYYKIASANDDSAEWAKVMAAIMQWKGWDREKSFFMFLNLAKYVEKDNVICSKFTNDLENVWIWVFIKKELLLNWKLLQSISDTRDKIFWKFNEKDEQKLLSDTKCNSYVNKAIRELNLEYIEVWNKKFMKNNSSWLPARNAKALFEEWYIKYLPIDYQQYSDYWIIYKYNYDTKNYDYSMWKYD